MPKTKVSHIISFSSEDMKFPASNLLKSENYRKWKCKDPGEQEASVILQLEKAERITSIDIGNECSAFVEVLVGRSSQPFDDFKVLLLTSSFMTPMESRNMTNVNRVRMFASDKLDKGVQKEKWDRIKVVCTQPYSKHSQYGLSFITFHTDTEDEESKRKPLSFGGFALKEEKKEDEFKAGSLFAGYKEKHCLVDLKGAAAIREASTSEGFPVSKAQSETKALLKEIEKRNKTESEVYPVSHKVNTGSSANNKRNIAKDKADDSEHEQTSKREKEVSKTTTNNRNNNIKDSKNSENMACKRGASPQSADFSKKKVKTETDDSIKYKRKPFNKLLEGVSFVISGFQNPLRGELRSKALEMGAKYKPDWNDSCTHLVCAFPNTPKFMQVLGKGHIVNSRWIEDGYNQRRRLPWRRYAMAKHEQGKEESEEEILEETDTGIAEDSLPENCSSADRGAPSGSDTDDEINRCINSSMACDESVDTRSNSNKSECYNCETEDESESTKTEATSKNGKLTVPHFPDFFSGYVFYVHPKVDSESRYELNRHIVAFKGRLVDIFTEEVTHVLVDEEMSDNLQLPYGMKDTSTVKTNWIWNCHDAGKLIPLDTYLIQF